MNTAEIHTAAPAGAQPRGRGSAGGPGRAITARYIPAKW